MKPRRRFYTSARRVVRVRQRFSKSPGWTAPFGAGRGRPLAPPPTLPSLVPSPIPLPTAWNKKPPRKKIKSPASVSTKRVPAARPLDLPASPASPPPGHSPPCTSVKSPTVNVKVLPPRRILKRPPQLPPPLKSTPASDIPPSPPSPPAPAITPDLRGRVLVHATPPPPTRTLLPKVRILQAPPRRVFEEDVPDNTALAYRRTEVTCPKTQDTIILHTLAS